MPNYTKHYNLVKPIGTDLYDISVQNGNMDILDEKLKTTEDLANRLKDYLDETSVTVTGNPTQIEIYQDAPLNVIAKINPFQSGTGTPSTTNVRKISGMTLVEVLRCGKNLFSTTWEQGNINTDTGEDENRSDVVRSGFVQVTPSTKYTITRDITTSYTKIRGYDRNKNYIGYGENVYTFVDGNSKTNPMNAGETTCSIITKENVYYLRFADVSNDLNTKYQLELGESSTEYEEFEGEVAAYDLGDIVYGGNLDCNTGLLTVTHVGMKLSELSSWRLSSNQAGRFVVDLEQPVGAVPICNVLPSGGNFSSSNTETQWTLFNNSGTQLVINTDLSTLTEWTTWMNNNNAFIVYQPLEPTTIQFTPNDFLALKPVTNISSNADEVEVTGRKDIIALTHYLLETIKHNVPDDSGWIDMTLSGATASDGDWKPKYRKIGNRVNIVGMCKLNAELATNATKVVFVLPEGFRPSYTIRVPINVGQGHAALQVETGGNVLYYNLYTAKINTTAQLSLAIDYLTD